MTTAEPQKSTRIVFLGDSLTAGYGLSKEEAYPTLVEELARQDGFSVISINGGVSGDTSAGGVRRLPWLLKEPADIFVVALGANDGLRGLPLTELRKNLTTIIDTARATYPRMKIVLAGMKLPLNFGEAYATEFMNVFATVAREKKAVFIPFLLEGVAGDPSLNIGDRIHPSAKGHQIMARLMWAALKPELN